MEILRGNIFLANLEPVNGSEQRGTRPVLIIQNNVFNIYSPTVIVAPITSKKPSKKYLTSVFILKKDSGLNQDSTILLNQIKTIDKRRIIKKISNIPNEIMRKVNLAIEISLELN